MNEIELRAYILHRRPYREHQYIVDLLTESEGKISAIVYSGKTQKSNKSGVLQPFLPLNVLLKGKGQLKQLKRIESVEPSLKLTGNYLYSALYLNELLVKLLGDSIPCHDLFHLYELCLKGLQSNDPIEIVLRNFESGLLDELGLSFDFEPLFIHNDAYFYYVHEQGFIPALDKRSLPCYAREHLEAIAQQDLSHVDVLKCYKGLMRQVINHLLGYKPLNSRKLFSKSLKA